MKSKISNTLEIEPDYLEAKQSKESVLAKLENG
jgi:hypothetical protein